MSKEPKPYSSIMKLFDKHSQAKLKTLAAPKHALNMNFEENFIRREKRRKMETRKQIDRMRAELPQYNMNDIRLFKLPFHQALIMQLEETGYVFTETYLKQLFELNERLRDEASSHVLLSHRPLLKHSDNELKKLSTALMKAEEEYNKGNNRGQAEILLSTAIDFAFNYTEWLWLAEDLILRAIKNTRDFKITGKHEATARFIYAKYLIEKVRDYDKAEQELNIAREISTGKSWNTKAFISGQTDSNTLYMNSNYLLHLCYMRQARYWLKRDQSKALEFATVARKRAVEACYHDGETMALFIKGQCELNMGNTRDAVSTFHKAYYIQSKLHSEKGICEARVELSKAYLMHGNTKLALSTLLALKTMAEEHGFQYYLAQAYRYLGEYYLNCGEPDKATPLLSEALKIFHSTGNIAESDQVRNLGALSIGSELLPAYIELLQRTDIRFPGWYDNLIKLLKWKDLREPFVTQKSKKFATVDVLVNTMNRQSEQQIYSPETEGMAAYEELLSIYEPRISGDSRELLIAERIDEEEEIEEAMETDDITPS